MRILQGMSLLWLDKTAKRRCRRKLAKLRKGAAGYNAATGQW